MIRQTHTYLAGAVSGTALVAAAVVAFVLLVSFQALRDWPLADLHLGGGGDDAARSPGQAGGADSLQATQGATAGAATGTAGGRDRAPRADRDPAQATGTKAAVGASPAPAAASPKAESPAPGPTGGQSPASATPNPNGSASSSAGSAGGNGGAGGGGGASNPGAGGSGGGGAPSTSEAVTGTVNKTVSGVDQVTGGALGSTGVTKVTEEVVNGVAGPESVVGKTVDETVKAVGETVGGLRGGKR